MTSSPGEVLVTGATGNVGREVVRSLRELSIPLRAAGTSAEKIADAVGDDVSSVELDFRRAETYGAALEGVEGVFLLRPPPIGDVKETLNVFVDRAVGAGVRHITFLSVEGADRQPWVPHHKVEKHLIHAPVSRTLLRPGFFAQNLGDAYLRDIRRRSEIYVPAKRGKVAFVDVRDVAELAARSFVEPVFKNRALTLTGPNALTFDQVARILSRELGRDIRYRPASIPGYLLHLRRQGAGWSKALIQTVLHLGIRFGNAEKVDPTLEQWLGRKPRTLSQYVHDHLHLWE
jgi:uncharacterized protein YbjT (DUF2867 family)